MRDNTPSLYRNLYMWLGADAEAAAAEAETYERLTAELPAIDATGEEG